MKNNIFLEKISENELEDICGRGSVLVCDEKMPSYINPKPSFSGVSSVYAAWVWAHCTTKETCPTTTWGQINCYNK